MNIYIYYVIHEKKYPCTHDSDDNIGRCSHDFCTKNISHLSTLSRETSNGNKNL